MDPKEIDSEHGFDLDERDPMHKNDHVRALYEEAFAEPEGTHSIDGVWNCSYKTYKGAKSCCYIVLSVLCGGPCALLWGLMFACQSFYHIWILGPCIKSYMMDLNCYAYFWRSGVECFCNPCYDAVGRIFGNVKFNHRYEVV